MGLLDDAASLVSGRTSHHSAHSKHHHRKSSSHHARAKSRSRSRSRPRSLAASVFGIGSEADRDRDCDRHRHHSHREDKHEKRHSSSRSLFDGGSVFGGAPAPEHGHRHESSSKRERDRLFFGLGNASRGSFFGLGNASRGSFFGFGGGRSPSYYKRSPRTSFVQRVLKQLKRLLRDLVYYAKKHPWRVFMLVIMPLVTTGALTALLARFGLRLPNGLERMMGIAVKVGSGDSIGLVSEAVRMASGGLSGGYGHSHASVERGHDGGFQWERKSVERDDYSGWGSSGGGGWGDDLMKGMAKMFF